MVRRAAILGFLLPAALFAGCYGSTEPASDIGPDYATLNATGTVNNGDADSYFQYWLTGTTQLHSSTPMLDWPDGVSGPFSQKVRGLAASSSYSFRMCGSDQGGGACAQTRTFTTQAAVEDSVFGSDYLGCCGQFDVDARSSASGANPRGTISGHYFTGGDVVNFRGVVTCLAVHGNRAAVGAVGQATFASQDVPPTNETWLVTIVDGHLQADTEHSVTLENTTTPPDCANASFDHQVAIEPRVDWVVNDATP